MTHDHALCPRCRALLGEAQRCSGCGLAFERRGGIIDVIGPAQREARAADVERFYTKSPFPGYGSGEDGASLLDRSRRSPFLVALDRAVPADARVLDCGCGTAQLAAFLALSASGRRVIGIDGCGASLECADRFRERVDLRNLELVRGDLLDLPVADSAFEFVVSRGVVHHTPVPEQAIACVARTVAPGGVLLLGFYETMARALHCARRGLGRVVGRELRILDPVLRRRELEEHKKRIWIDDQYRHPLEHILPLPRVQAQLRSLGFRIVRTIPPLTSGTALFDAAPEPGAAGLFALRLSWMLRGLNDPDAGLVFVVARRTG
jgi:ubiquinone/menaquinone biosynthesis C-methylase UbiE